MTADDPFSPGYHSPAVLDAAGFAAVGKNVRISRSATILGRGSIRLADNVRIDGYVTLIAADAPVTIGRNVHIGAYCALGAAAGLTIGDFAGLSQGVRLFTRSDDYSGAAMTNPTVPAEYTRVGGGPVRIGRHAIIGASCVVLPGLDVGEGAAVGALSLVNADLDCWTIYAGVPARALRQRSRQLLELEAAYLAGENGRRPS